MKLSTDKKLSQQLRLFRVAAAECRFDLGENPETLDARIAYAIEAAKIARAYLANTHKIKTFDPLP